MTNPKLVAIVNVTPDSFSDGGHFLQPDVAIERIEELHNDGADVIDIGAESTRPGATPINADEEWQRLEPVLSTLSRLSLHSEISVDTRHPQTAIKALDLGVHWINDVSGFADAQMVSAVKNSRCKLVVMHSLSVPADKNITMNPAVDVVAEIIDFAHNRINSLEKSGIDRSRIIFDPGLGFGKTAPQSLEILRRIKELNRLNAPLLVGHSRKSFLRAYGDVADAATLVISQYLADHTIDYLRVHNIPKHVSMLKMLNDLRHEPS